MIVNVMVLDSKFLNLCLYLLDIVLFFLCFFLHVIHIDDKLQRFKDEFKEYRKLKEMPKMGQIK